MKFFLRFLLLVLGLASFVRADTSVTYPYPSPPSGSNPAIFPAPRVEWLNNFGSRVVHARQMPEVSIIFDGDSITDFWQGNGKEIWTKYAKLNAMDFAISGDQTQHVLWRLQQGQADNLKPKLIFLMIGTNNVPSCTAEQIADGVKAIIDEYRKVCPDAVVVLQAIFPRDPTPETPNRQKIKAINALISKFDDGKNVIYLDFADKFLQPDGTLSKDIMPDYLHPSAKGYQIWADQINPIINRFFPAARLPLSNVEAAPAAAPAKTP